MAHALRYLICACALLLAAPWIAGQAPKPAPIRFSVFALRPIEGLTFPATNGTTQPLKFSAVARSARYTCLGASPIKFLDATTGEVVAEATVPTEIRDPLLLFLDPPANNPRHLRYQVAVLDDSAAKLGSGQFAILNLSGLKLTGTLDTKDLTLEPGLNPPIPVKSGAKLILYTTARGTRVLSYAETLKPSKAARLLLILFPPARKGGLEVQARFLAEEPLPPPPSITVPIPRK